MPFDGKLTDFIPVPTVKPFDFDTATGDERLLELARWLDDDQAWRDKVMAWDFTTVLSEPKRRWGFSIFPVCGTAGCALGLARMIWPQFDCDYRSRRDDGEIHFNITRDEWFDLFDEALAIRLGVKMFDVTPGMVATAIREFVSKRSAA